jgi:hypothetical protein
VTGIQTAIINFTQVFKQAAKISDPLLDARIVVSAASKRTQAYKVSKETEKNHVEPTSLMCIIFLAKHAIAPIWEELTCESNNVDRPALHRTPHVQPCQFLLPNRRNPVKYHSRGGRGTNFPAIWCNGQPWGSQDQ